ncbi:MAG: cadmium-translocating P-type ATPase [Treponema sp.]|nr:cadmium-translocating P-type ATPase [Treponema sp.]
MNKKQKKNFIRIIASSILIAVILLLPVSEKTKFFLFFIPYLVIGYDILLKALKGIINLKPFDENFLMAVATVGAIALGEYTEGVAVMLFYQIGELFQSIAVGKSRRNISELMDIRPDYANLEIDFEKSEIKTVSPEEVKVGSIIVVKPGEKIPIDGVIVEGKTTLNTSALTGECIPREVKEDDEVLGGCINCSGVIRVRTVKEFGQSTASKILELVESASSKKSKSEYFISKFARIYTPVVCIAALALALIPPVVRMFILNTDALWNLWIYRALTFLVISCPCALVISIPLTFFAGIGGASSAGILIKGSNYMESLSKVRYLVFDKTGTMTKGVFEVTGVHHGIMENEKLLEIAALAECYSNHPISKSLMHAYGKEIDKTRVSDVKEISGHGISAVVDGKQILAGNAKLMISEKVEFTECHCAGTIIHIAIDRKYAGHIVISDIVKPDSALAVKNLKALGIKQTVMLTGDSKRTAEKVAEEIAIDKVYSELLPQDKVSKVEELLNQKDPGENLAFVGDGINDAPVLSRADIGIAMGALGSDAAIEASDVVLMDDNPLKISKAIRISKKCMRIVYQNIAFALGVKFACLVLGALGISNMWTAIFADVGVMVLCVLNAIRVLFGKKS